MRKLMTFIAFLAMMCVSVKAQEEPLVSPEDSLRSLVGRLFPTANPNVKAHMNLEFYTSAAAYFTNGHFDEAAFKLNRVRMEILGSFSKDFSYHFRQSFNKYSNPHSLDNLSSSIEFAYVNWKPSAKFNMTVGKQFLSLGGYEYYLNAMKVNEFCEFNNNVSAYQAGITASINFTPNQELVLQLLNNRSSDDNDVYVFGRPEALEKAKVPVISALNWNGWFADRTVQLRYAAAWGQQTVGRNVLYLTAGNIYEKAPIIAYLDFMYSRQGLDAMGVVSSLQGAAIENPVTAQHTEYFAIIGDIDYRFHSDWNVYLKGAYETAGVYKDNGAFAKGLYRTSWNAQTCLEYFPMHNSELKLFVHLLYKGHSLTKRARALGGSSPDTQRVTLGLVYTIPVF